MRARLLTLTSAAHTRLAVAFGFSASIGIGALAQSGRGLDEVLALVALFTLCASAVAGTGTRQVLAVLVMVLSSAPAPVARPYPELASQVGQSVPDAPGKPQPRAPGRALQVA